MAHEEVTSQPHIPSLVRAINDLSNKLQELNGPMEFAHGDLRDAVASLHERLIKLESSVDDLRSEKVNQSNFYDNFELSRLSNILDDLATFIRSEYPTEKYLISYHDINHETDIGKLRDIAREDRSKHTELRLKFNQLNYYLDKIVRRSPEDEIPDVEESSIEIHKVSRFPDHVSKEKILTMSVNDDANIEGEVKDRFRINPNVRHMVVYVVGIHGEIMNVLRYIRILQS